MKVAFIKTISKKEKLLTQCLHSNTAPIFQLANGKSKLNYPKKNVGGEVLSDAVKITRKNSRVFVNAETDPKSY